MIRNTESFFISEQRSINAVIQENGTEFARLLSAVLRLSLLDQPNAELVEIGEGTLWVGDTLCMVVHRPFGIDQGRQANKEKKTTIRRLILVAPTENESSARASVPDDVLRHFLAGFNVTKKALVTQ